MPDLKRLVREIHRRSLWQVLAIYLGSGWLILQVVDTLAGALNLPEWADSLALFLLIVGLPIVLATAFVQGAPPASDEPSGPQRGPGEGQDAEGAIKRHLTWPKALIGGVVAFSLLFGVAGLRVILSDRNGDEGAAASEAGEVEPAIAVLPFTVADPELAVWREGMVDALTPPIDGVRGIRAIPNRTVHERWNARVGAAGADLETSLQVARDAGARFALIGTLVSSGASATVHLQLYDAATGEQLHSRRVDGSSNDMTALIDRAAAQTARAVLEARGRLARDVTRALDDFEVERLTDSPEALLAFLEGEVAFRDYELLEARAAYERAVAIDSAFAFAHLRLAEVAQWGATFSFGEGSRRIAVAARHPERLTERAAVLTRAVRASGVTADSILRDAVTNRFPDDALLWYHLGEALIHGSEGFPVVEEIRHAFNRALELDPGRGATYPHALHLEFMESADTARVRGLIRRFGEIAGDIEGAYTADADPRVAPFAFDLVFGDAGRRAAARAAIDTLPPDFLLAAARYVNDPRWWNGFEALHLAVLRHPEAGRAGGFFGTMRGTSNRDLVIGYSLWRGRPGRGLEFASGSNLALGPDESSSRGLLYFLHSLEIRFRSP